MYTQIARFDFSAFEITWFDHMYDLFRDRPFNLQGAGVGGGIMVFYFVQNNFFGQHKSQNIYFFLSRKAQKYFFQQHWESEYFFRKKKHNPPFKLNGRSLTKCKNKNNPKMSEVFASLILQKTKQVHKPTRYKYKLHLKSLCVLFK